MSYNGDSGLAGNIDEALTSSLTNEHAHAPQNQHQNLHTHAPQDNRRPSIANLLMASKHSHSISSHEDPGVNVNENVPEHDTKPTRGLDSLRSPTNLARPQPSYGYAFAGYGGSSAATGPAGGSSQPPNSSDTTSANNPAGIANPSTNANTNVNTSTNSSANANANAYFQQAYFASQNYPNYYNGQPYSGVPAAGVAVSGTNANYFGAENENTRETREQGATSTGLEREQGHEHISSPSTNSNSRHKKQPIPNTGVLAPSDDANTNTNTNTSDRPYSCTFPNCTWAFARLSDQRRHLKSHYKPTFQCPFWKNDPTCHRNGGAFNRLDVLKRHLRLVHFVQFKENENGWCRVCNKMFTSAKQFLDHCEACAEEDRPAEWKVDVNDRLSAYPSGRHANASAGGAGMVTVNAQRPFDEQRSLLDLSVDAKLEHTKQPPPPLVPRSGTGRKKTLSQSIQAGHHSAG